MHILIVNPNNDALPPDTNDVFREAGWTVSTVADYRLAAETVRSCAVDAVVAPESDRNDDQQRGALAELLSAIETRRLPGVLLGDDPRDNADTKTLVDRVSRNITSAELRGRLATMERYHTHFQRVERELGRMEQLGKQLTNHFKQVDREMRLAARLQREYLPKLDDPIGNVRFHALYRPANWVSGDMFGVFPIDRNHTGFYVADVVGHGVAASLLTIYIKQALEPRASDRRSAVHDEPARVLEALNTALVELALPSCQFVTACYAVLNHQTLTLRYAGAGHPYPIHITPSAGLVELPATGGLLGLCPKETFETCRVQLSPGDGLLLYTDGLELAFQEQGESRFQRTRYFEVLESLAGPSMEELLARLNQALDHDRGSLHPNDDVTVLGLQIPNS